MIQHAIALMLDTAGIVMGIVLGGLVFFGAVCLVNTVFERLTARPQ